jgi:hypothetical protein
MTEIPKHEQPANDAPTPVVNVDVDMSGVELELANIARCVKSYVVNAADGENSFNLFTGKHNYPVKIQLTAGTDEEDCTIWVKCEALDRIATAFERVADALAGNAPAAERK